MENLLLLWKKFTLTRKNQRNTRAFELDLLIFYAETLNHRNRERKRYDCMENEMMSSEMACHWVWSWTVGYLQVLWIKLFHPYFLVFVFGIWDFGMLVFLFHSESLKVPLYFLVFSIPRFLQRVLQHRKVCTFCCFWCSRISFCPRLTALLT